MEFNFNTISLLIIALLAMEYVLVVYDKLRTRFKVVSVPGISFLFVVISVEVCICWQSVRLLSILNAAKFG